VLIRLTNKDCHKGVENMELHEIISELHSDVYKLSVFIGFISGYLEETAGKEGAKIIIEFAYDTANTSKAN
jgi:hypothetical protein